MKHAYFVETKVKKNEQKLVQAERKNFEVNFKKCANWLDDEEIVRKISNNDFIAKEIRYNGFCRTEYQTRARKSPKGKEEEMNQEEPAETNWHKEREVYSQAFESIEKFVQVNIIDMKEVNCIKTIRTLYQSLIREMDGDKFKDASPSSQNVENNLLKQFLNEVCIIKGSTRQGNIIFSKTLSISDGFHKENSTAKFQGVQLRDAALVLREVILSRESMPLPENLTTDSVLHRTANVAPKLSQFFQYLICGPDLRRWKSDTKQRCIQSISQDVTLAVSSGCKLPSKHLKLRVALKS